MNVVGVRGARAAGSRRAEANLRSGPRLAGCRPSRAHGSRLSRRRPVAQANEECEEALPSAGAGLHCGRQRQGRRGARSRSLYATAEHAEGGPAAWGACAPGRRSQCRRPGDARAADDGVSAGGPALRRTSGGERADEGGGRARGGRPGPQGGPDPASRRLTAGSKGWRAVSMRSRRKGGRGWSSSRPKGR